MDIFENQSVAIGQMFFKRLAPELNADALRSMRENPPVMISFRRLSETQRKDRACARAAAVLAQKIGVITVVPLVGTK